MASFLKPATAVDEAEGRNADGGEAGATMAQWNPHHDSSVQIQRERLPIFASRGRILYAIESFDVVVITAETGSGKSTQVPQYLLEAGWASHGKCICCTQPRRVAATMLAARVSQERGVRLGQEVGFAVRFAEAQTAGVTRIKYVTDGLLLREAQSDPLLRSYSCVVVDEAHERSLQTDVLLGLLRRIKALRADLRVVIMSATIDAERFRAFFDGCSAGSRQLLLQPPEDYLRASADAALLVHRLEPPGDVLVFVPGAEEVGVVCHLVLEGSSWAMGGGDRAEPRPASAAHRSGTAAFAARASSARSGRAGVFDGFPDGAAADLTGEYQAGRELEVCPLHAKLPWQEQLRALRPGRMLAGGRRTRKVIVATSVAETSITLPGVAVVIDCGFTRRPAYDPASGLTGLVTRPVSIAQAVQRAGRAGRVRAGKCLRLYSEATLRALRPASPADISCAPLAPLVLQLLALGVQSLRKFRFLEPPPAVAMERALGELASMRAVEAASGLLEGVTLTDTGRSLVRLPVLPRHAAILLASLQPELHCTSEALSLVAMLTAGDPVVPQALNSQRALAASRLRAERAQQAGEEAAGESVGGSFHRFLAAEGDHLTLVNMFNAWEANGKAEAWCEEYGLRCSVLRRAGETRAVLLRALRAASAPTRGPAAAESSCGAEGELLLRAVVSGAPLQLARLGRGGAYVTLQGSRRVELRDTAVLSRLAGDASAPPWVAFDSMMVLPEGRLVIAACSAVDPRWALRAAPDLLALRESDPTRRRLAAAAAPPATVSGAPPAFTERELDDSALNRAVAGILGPSADDALQMELQARDEPASTQIPALGGLDAASRFHPKRLRHAAERGGSLPASDAVAGMELPSRRPAGRNAAPGSAGKRRHRGAMVSFDDDEDD